MWKDDDVFLQIPHMNEANLKKLRKQKKSITIEDFCKLSGAERKELQLFDSEAEYEDCEKAIRVFPLVELKAELFVDGENEIAVGDFLTQKFTIT
jgi:hypothetical protein